MILNSMVRELSLYRVVGFALPILFAGLGACRQRSTPPIVDDVVPSATADSSSLTGQLAPPDPDAAPLDGWEGPPNNLFQWSDRDENRAWELGEPIGRLDPARAYQAHLDTAIILTVGMCFGLCPTYTLSITGEGSVHLVGHRTQFEGYSTLNVPVANVRELLATFEQEHFHAFHRSYSGVGSDPWSATLVLRQGHDAAKVVGFDLTHCPEPLRILVNATERLARVSDRLKARISDVYVSPTPIPFRALLASEIVALQRTCAPLARPSTTLSMSIACDHFGRCRGRANEDRGTSKELRDCSEQATARLLLPISDANADLSVSFE